MGQVGRWSASERRSVLGRRQSFCQEAVGLNWWHHQLRVYRLQNSFSVNPAAAWVNVGDGALSVDEGTLATLLANNWLMISTSMDDDIGMRPRPSSWSTNRHSFARWDLAGSIVSAQKFRNARHFCWRSWRRLIATLVVPREWRNSGALVIYHTVA